MIIRLGFAVLLSVIVTTFTVYADCHDTVPCEEVEMRVKGFMYWPPIVRQSVSFQVDPDYSGKPNMLDDVKAAAEAWSRIDYKGGDIDISFTYNDTPTSRDAGVEDDKNVISYE